jgi:radical SAM superfamily enzyme YgiQ (UPF0313 family)
MNILLIQAPLGRPETPIYPLGLSCLAAVLEDRHHVEILDANVHSRDRIRERVETLDPDVIGFGVRNIETSQSFDDFRYIDHFPEFVRWVRGLSSRSTFVVGGAGFSVFPFEVMEACPEIDFGVELEGETTFPELLDRLDSAETVPGIYYRCGEAVRYSGPRELPDFAGLPRPIRMPDLAPYQQETFQLGVQTKRGCPHRCLYCDYPYLNGNRLRLRDPVDVVDEIETLGREHGVDRFFFSDGVFNEPRRHAEEVCREMIRRRLGIRWSGYFTLRSFDRSFLELATEAGCELFGFAPDGLRQATLDALDKGIHERQLHEVLELFRDREFPRLGMWFMFNVPGATFRDFLLVLRATLWWPLRYKGLHLVGVTNMRVYPNTPLQRVATRGGRISSSRELFKTVFYDPWPLRPLSRLLGLARKAQLAAQRLLGRGPLRGGPYRTDDTHRAST